MQTRTASSTSSTSDMSNFRVFTSESDVAIYGESLENTTDDVQYIAFVLVSIMSSFFQKFETLKYIMSAAYHKYHSQIPVVYVCGDTVYRNTESCLFASKNRDPIQKGRDSWKEKYDRVITEFQENRLNSNQAVVYWDTVKESLEYLNIRKFTNIVFNPDLNLEILQKAFPDVEDKTMLEDLLQRIQSARISDKVNAIAAEFKAKNLTKLNKREKKEKGRQKFLKPIFDALDNHGVKIGENITEVEKLKSELLIATHSYLAEEFAVFIALSLLQNVASVSAKLGLDISGLEQGVKLKPILNYPISSTKGSDVIFTTFRLVENFYLNYCVQLHLPIIIQPVMIADLVVPKNYHPDNVSHAVELLEKKSANSEITMTSTTSNLDESNVNEEINKSNEADTLFAKTAGHETTIAQTHALSAYSPRFAFATETTSSQQIAAQKKHQSEESITERIIQKIDEHLESQVRETRLTYKNGVTCEIKITGPSKTIDQTFNLQQMKNLVKSAVVNVKKAEDCEEAVFFDYKGYAFELTVKPTFAYTESLNDKNTNTLNMRK